MCSTSKCDMAGLLAGPVGNLMGAGITALVNGASIGPRTTQLSQKSTGNESVKQFYDNIEAHLKGTLQVLQPALEIKRILTGECKSADRGRPVSTSSIPIVYYSPQNSKTSHTSNYSARCSNVNKPVTNRASERCNSAKIPHLYNYSDKSTAPISSQVKDSSSIVKSSYKCEKNISKKCFSPINRETTGKASCTNANVVKCSSGKSSKMKEVCCVCGISLKQNSILAVLPCEHLFCYTCLAKTKCTKCQQCDKFFDMKNVTQIARS